MLLPRFNGRCWYFVLVLTSTVWREICGSCELLPRFNGMLAVDFDVFPRFNGMALDLF